MSMAAFQIDPLALLAIAGMALATLLTRLSGYWLIGFVPIRGRVKAALEAAPAAILTAIVAPMALAQGPAEAAGVAATALAALRLPTLAAVALGVAVVVAGRHLAGL